MWRTLQRALVIVLAGAVLGKPAAIEHQPARDGEVRDSVAATGRGAPFSRVGISSPTSISQRARPVR